jgi:2-keto-3-deoxy-L-rhamnonate aldolase RhmA
VTAPPSLLDRVRSGQPALMLGIRTSRTPEVVRIARATGHHAIMVDLEHATLSLDVAAHLCATARDLGLTGLVRVRERDYGSIGPLLDGGAQGIIAPRIESAAEAMTIARACRFAPAGQRSAIAGVPQTDLRPTPAAELNRRLDRETIVQILLETPIGIKNAESIAAIDGVDMLAIGVNDLTAELGIPGEQGAAPVREAIETVAAACRRHGKPLMVGGMTDAALICELGGCSLYLTGIDTDLLFREADARAQRWLAAHPAAAPTLGRPKETDG